MYYKVYLLTRDVTREECRSINKPIQKGTILFEGYDPYLFAEMVKTDPRKESGAFLVPLDALYHLDNFGAEIWHCKTIDEIKDVLWNRGGITDPHNAVKYTAEALEIILEIAKKDLSFINYVPLAYGLRDKVSELLGQLSIKMSDIPK